MTYRTIQVVVRRIVTYERKVTVQVEETAERVEYAPRYPELYADEAKDASVEKAKTHTLTGWEPVGQAEYEAVSAQVVDRAGKVDVTV